MKGCGTCESHVGTVRTQGPPLTVEEKEKFLGSDRASNPVHLEICFMHAFSFGPELDVAPPNHVPFCGSSSSGSSQLGRCLSSRDW